MHSGELVGVGAFAQLAGLTVETLRHYHQVGLLVPAEVDGRTGGFVRVMWDLAPIS